VVNYAIIFYLVGHDKEEGAWEYSKWLADHPESRPLIVTPLNADYILVTFQGPEIDNPFDPIKERPKYIGPDG
jgi:hypothetical protein